LAIKEIQLLEYGTPVEPKSSEKKCLQKEGAEFPNLAGEFAHMSELIGKIIVSYYCNVNIFKGISKCKLRLATPEELETAEIEANDEMMKEIQEGAEDIRQGNVISYEELKRKHGLK
jgi:hypothetical protein